MKLNKTFKKLAKEAKDKGDFEHHYKTSQEYGKRDAYNEVHKRAKILRKALKEEQYYYPFINEKIIKEFFGGGSDGNSG